MVVSLEPEGQARWLQERPQEKAFLAAKGQQREQAGLALGLRLWSSRQAP